MIVVDASVAVKWYVSEADTEFANALISGSEQLRAPELIRIEVTAALMKKVRRGETTRTEIDRQLTLWRQAWGDGTVQLSSDELDLPVATTLALELAHPLQDCLYLALALRLGAPLVTADRRFAIRAGHRAPIDVLGVPPASTH
jgi:predicted nucleic acid-binding protein